MRKNEQLTYAEPESNKFLQRESLSKITMRREFLRESLDLRTEELDDQILMDPIQY